MIGSAALTTPSQTGTPVRADTMGLYVHVPWCVRKCPYCDFNSHRRPDDIDETSLVSALLADLRAEADIEPLPPVETVFIGGGTPSLLSGSAVAALLDGIAATVTLCKDTEITLEANPGSSDMANFRAYRAAGVNRLSIGVQSFSDASLKSLGRIHDGAEARDAIAAARAAGFANINVDLMYGLPDQDVAGALADLTIAIETGPEHLSWYQLTLEPNTVFHHKPPPLPVENLIDDISDAGRACLAEAGLRRYEVSAYATGDHRCGHNLNYWRFGDYVGIGPGAHGKRTRDDGRILRRCKKRGPTDYLAATGSAAVSNEWQLERDDLVIEFMLNALRLVDGVTRDRFAKTTGLPDATVAAARVEAISRGLLVDCPDRWQATPLGLAYLNDLLALFMSNS